MLTLLWGRSGSGKTTAILEELVRRASEGETGLIWLTPEPFSHECERMLARRGGPSVCLAAEVLTFKRLCERVFDAEGGGVPALDEGGRLLAMRLAVDTVAQDLTLWRGSVRKAGFLSRLLATLDQCKCYGVTPEILLSASERADGSAQAKLTELAMIFAAYNGQTARLDAEGAVDPRDRLEVLRRKLEEGGYLAGKRLYVDGYVTFTPLECSVLDACIRRAEAVTLALTGTPDDPFFEVTQRTARRLCRHIPDEQTRSIVLPGSLRAQDDGLRLLERRLLAETVSAHPDPETLPAELGEVQETQAELAICESPAAELHFAAETLRHWLGEGLRCRDIAVIVPETGPYEALAEAALDKAGIPVFMDRLDDIRTKPLPRLLKASSDVLEHGWKVEDVLELLRTGLTRVSARDAADGAADELENYIRLWKLGKRHWTSSEPWNLPPRGYSQAPTPEDEALLRRINRVRALFSVPLRILSGGRTAEDWAVRTARYLEACRVPRALKRRAAQLEALGERKLAEENRQLWDLLCTALEQCAAVLGTRPMDRAEFFDFLGLTLSAYGVGSIPASLDRVTVGTAGRLRRLQVRAVILPGCRASLMPRFDAPDSLLAREELAALEDVHDALPPDGEERLSRALFDLYMSVALPSERLLMTCCAEENGRLAPAALFEGAARLLGTVPLEPLRPTPPEAEWAYLRSGLDEDAVESLYGRDIYLSASRLKSLSDCKQAFFLRYGLRAQTRRDEGFAAMDKGSFVHEVLERTGRHFEGRDLREVSDGELRETALGYAQAYAETSLQGFQGQGRRFEQSFAALQAAAMEAVDDVFGELRRSAFRPIAYELAFGSRRDGEPSLPAIPAGRIGRFSVLVGGKVDRVDAWRGPDGKIYVRAVDYKTGASGFDLAALAHGGAVQLPLYLAALTGLMPSPGIKEPDIGGAADTHSAPTLENTLAQGAEPAGFLYIPTGAAPARHKRRPTDDEQRSEQRKKNKRKGLLLDDPLILRAMEEPGGDSDEGGVLPVRYKKDGTLYATSSTLSEKQMRGLSRHVRDTLAASAEALAAGDVSASPTVRSQDDACKLCDYPDCCYFDERRDTPVTLGKADRKALADMLDVKFESGKDETHESLES